MTSQYALTINNEKLWKFYKSHPSLDFEKTNLLFIDVLGNEEIHLDSGFVASNFHNGFAVLHRPNGNVCFIDKKGNIAFDFGFSLLTDFIEGFAFFTRSNGSQGYIDCSGSIIWETKPIKK